MESTSYLDRSILSAVTTVRTVNSSIAKFLSLSDEARLLMMSSSNTPHSNICHLGSSAVTRDAYLAINVDGTCNMVELASFNTASNHLNAPLNISGHLISTDGGDLGSYDKQWNNVYLGGNHIHINDAMIEYYREDPDNPSENRYNNKDIYIKDKKTGGPLSVAAESLKLVNSDNYSCILTTSVDGPVITSYDSNGDLINSINFGQLSTSMLPQGTNKYFDMGRVLQLVGERMENTSDYSLVTSNNIIRLLGQTSNQIIEYLNNSTGKVYDYVDVSSNIFARDIIRYDTQSSNSVSNTQRIITSNIDATSNTLMQLMGTLDKNASNYVSTTSNMFSSNIVTTSNLFVGRISTYDTNIKVHLDKTSNLLHSNILITSNTLAGRVNTLNSNITKYVGSIVTTINAYPGTTSNAIQSNITRLTSNMSNNVRLYVSDKLNSNINITSNSLRKYINTLDSDASNYIRTSSNAINTRLTNTSNTIAGRLVNLNADQILTTGAVSEKFIVDNIYAGDLLVSNLTVIGNLLPAANLTYDLGSSNYRWADIFVGNNSIYLGDTKLSSSDTESGISITDNTQSDTRYMELIVNTIKLEESSGQYTVLQSRDNKLISGTTSVGSSGSGSSGVSETISTTDEIGERAVNPINLYFTPARMGAVAEEYNNSACNLAKGYYDQFASYIDNINTDQINNGSTKHTFIVNNEVNSNLTIKGTLTASNLTIIGKETYFKTEKFSTSNLEVVAASSVSGQAAFSIRQNTSCNIAEFYSNTTPLMFITSDGNVGMGKTNPQATLDVVGGIYTGGNINGITNTKFGYINTVTSNIQQQLDNIVIASLVTSFTEDSNVYIEIINQDSSTNSNYVDTASNNMFKLLDTQGSNFTYTVLPTRDTATSNIIRDTFDTYSNLLMTTSNTLSLNVGTLSTNMSNLVDAGYTSNMTNLSTKVYDAISSHLNDIVSYGWNPIIAYDVSTSSGAYKISGLSGDNPALTLYTGNTYAFKLSTSGHPFLIQLSGTNISDGLLHIAPDGTQSTGSSAQEKTSGTLYWNISTSISQGTYKYVCQEHSGMTANITVTQNAKITSSYTSNNLYYTNKVGIGTAQPVSNLDVVGNIKFSGTINGITSTELSHLNNIDYNIQSKFADINTDTSNYTESTSNNVSSNISDYVIKITSDVATFESSTRASINGIKSTLEGRLDAQLGTYGEINNRIYDLKPDPWTKETDINYILNDNVGIGTDFINNRLEIAGGSLLMLNGDIKKKSTGMKPFSPIIWYQFNEDPTEEGMVYDSNNISSVKYNLSIANAFTDKTNMVAWYKFENSTNVGLDSYGGQHLTNTGNVVVDTVDPIKNTGCAKFSGTNYLSRPNDGRFAPESFTIAFWCKIANPNVNQAIASCYKEDEDGKNQDGWMLNVVNKGIRLYIYRVGNNYGDNLLVSTTNVDLDTNWNYVVVTFDWDQPTSISSVKTYFNGKTTQSYTPDDTMYGNLAHTGSTFYIGKIGQFNAGNSLSLNNAYLGAGSLIDDFRFYNRALTATEIAGLYNIINISSPLTPYLYRNAYRWNGGGNILQHTDQANIRNLLKAFHNNNGFTIHFVFNTFQKTATVTFFTIKTSSKTYIELLITSGNLTLIVNGNSYIICGLFDSQTYYNFDILFMINKFTNRVNILPFLNNALAKTIDSSSIEISFQYTNDFFNVSDTLTGFEYTLFNTKAVSYFILQDFRIYPYDLTSNQRVAVQTGATSYQAFSGTPIIETYQIERWKDGGTDANKFIYYNEGKVGIGNSAPEAPLHVGTQAIFTTYTGKYFTQGNTELQTATNTSTAFSAKFDSSILVKSSIVASSDARIKKNIQDINDDSALDKILSIQPKTYNYIDPIRGEDTVYGFIAQQIREVIPEAVKIQKAIIPNVFCVAECFLNVITFDHDISAYGMVSGTKVSIIDRTGNQSIYTIANDPSDTNSIVLDRNISSDKVFVYGTEIDDFHALDKNYIFTLNVCATQRLSQKIDNLMHRIAYLEYLSANVQ
jgi:hypothetical protein